MKEKQQITINLDRDVIDYFKGQSGTSGIPYQTLINLYLSDCVTQKRELVIPPFSVILKTPIDSVLHENFHYYEPC